MLEHVPNWLGKLLSGLRAGSEKLVIAQPGLGRFDAIRLASPAFADHARLPERFTADGEGVSPPLYWTGVPDEAERLVLIVEDADAPAPQPLVHAIVWNLPGADGDLAEGAIRADCEGGDDGSDVGRTSFGTEGWLPPDPPTGHGEHRYAFQVFALAAGADIQGKSPGRSAIVKAMAGHVLAAGILTGTYSRRDEAPVGPVGATRPATA